MDFKNDPCGMYPYICMNMFHRVYPLNFEMPSSFGKASRGASM